MLMIAMSHQRRCTVRAQPLASASPPSPSPLPGLVATHRAGSQLTHRRRASPLVACTVTFVGGAPAKIALKPDLEEGATATAGDPVPVLVEVHDRFNNRCADVDCEVVLAASHGAEFGEGPIQLENGEATIQLVSTVAATVSLSVLQVCDCL